MPAEDGGLVYRANAFLEQPHVAGSMGLLLFMLSVGAKLGYAPSGHFWLPPLAYAALGATCFLLALRELL